MATTLGLDLGPNSIGWALLDDKHVIGTGVRIFQEGVDAFDTSKESSRNEQRRIARGMRRQTKRRNQRKRIFRNALIQAGLWPQEAQQQVDLLGIDPYALRAKAVNEKITAYELGRVLLHMNQRRGFLSNRKKDRNDQEVKGMLGKMSELQAAMEAQGCTTLGQYLHHKAQNLVHTQRVDDDHIRNRHTRRAMLEAEFELIWDTQRKHHPDLITESLCYGSQGKAPKYPIKPRTRMHASDQSLLKNFGMHGLIFFQRPMYWPKSAVGLCELEPKEKRCPRADRLAQRFRLLTEINNLRLIDNTINPPLERPLSSQERIYLLDQLQTKEKATFDQLAGWIGKLPDSPPAQGIQFNLQKGKRATIKGMVTDYLMVKNVDKKWHQRDEQCKNAIVRLLLEVEHDEDQAMEKLVTDYGLTPEQADAAVRINFVEGYLHLSRKALEKLLPFMEQGMVYMAIDESNSAMHAAEYLRPDQLQRRLFDKLPRQDAFNCPLGAIPNPVVKRTLNELRRVMNSIIRTYGKPDAIHLEMARSVSMGGQARKEFSKIRNEREKQRDTAATEIRKLGVRVNRDAITQYLLWEQQNHECLYTGQKISQNQLFSGEVDIDHILPRSQSLDNSQANKVLCFRKANSDKSQRTVYNWLANTDPHRFEEIGIRALSFVKNHGFPYGKYKKLMQKEVDVDSFIARQLTDTGYIAKATREYLACLYDDDKSILGLKGQHTATLRTQWGLSRILHPDDLDLKTRDDHRHHAIDAIVVAATNRSRLQALSKGYQEVERIDFETGEVSYRQAHKGPALAEPWETFRDDVEKAVNTINVSHRVNRKISGALHEETVYAPVKENNGQIKPNTFVVRKPLLNLSANEIAKIRDAGIRRIVENALTEKGIDVWRGKAPDKKKFEEALHDLTMPSGVPIKKVRVFRDDQTIQPIRQYRAHKAQDPTQIAYVKPGNTHHLCIFKMEANGKIKYEAVFVPMIEAINRIKMQQNQVTKQISQLSKKIHTAKQRKVLYSQFYKQASEQIPLINRKHPTQPKAQFVMSLSRGELVEYRDKPDAQPKIMVLKTAISTNQRLIFALQTDARKSSDYHKIGVSPKDFSKIRKVTINPLGQVRWAND